MPWSSSLNDDHVNGMDEFTGLTLSALFAAEEPAVVDVFEAVGLGVG